MGLIITVSDFLSSAGKLAIAQDNVAATKITSYILRYEEQYLIDLLGVELFNLFKADIASPPNPPASPIYAALYDPIRQDDGTCIRISRGMKDMVMGFLWWEYMRDAKFRQALTGMFVDKSENSREAPFDEYNIYGRYNESIESYQTIQWYIKKDTANAYPTYNGQCKDIAHWSL